MSNSNNTTKIDLNPHKDGGGSFKMGAQNPPGREEAGLMRSGGLSTCHNRTKINEKSGTLRFYSDGSLIEVTKNRTNPYANNDRDWVRGKVKTFSKRSRSRLMKTLAKVNKKELPLFLTLTYPSEYPQDFEVYKSDLKKFYKRLKYRFPNISCVWKLEFQKRGAPHFHLLIWGLPGVIVMKLVSLLWFQVVGSGDEKHLLAGTNLQKIRSWRGVVSYASKYMGKLDVNSDGYPGRFWGVMGRDDLPWSAIHEFKVFPNQVVMAMRYFRRYAGIKSRDYSSLSVYVNNMDQWKRALLC